MVLRCATITLLIAMAGCGSSGPSVGAVHGVVTLDGDPVAAGTIILLPESGRMARGKIQDGQIVEVTTFSPSDGAIVGSVKIAVQPAVIMDNPGNVPEFMGRPARAGERGYVPKLYGDPIKSGLTAQIKSGKNELNLELTDK